MKLWQQIILGLILGVIAGLVLKENAVYVKPLGTIFLTLIKMVVVPLIFFALVSGITSLNDSHNFTRVGLKGLVAYLCTASFAVIIGIVAGIIFKPGEGLNLDIASLTQSAAIVTATPTTPPSISEFLLNLIPDNALRAMTEDNFLQVIVFAAFTGVTINLMGEKSHKARELIHEFAQVMFKMISIIVKLAPLAVFGFIAWMVGTQGLEVIESLTKLVITVLIACIFQYFLFGLMILIFARVSPLPFYKKMLATQAMAFGTSSSKATLTTAMRELQEKMGVSEKGTNFLMPLGACINMDGTAIYLGICALFFSQIFNIPLDMHDYLILILTSTLGSMGAAGIPSGSIIFMGMVLSSVGLPIEGIGIILGIDRILDMIRTTLNITGDATITLIVDSSEKQLDKKTYYA